MSASPQCWRSASSSRDAGEGGIAPRGRWRVRNALRCCRSRGSSWSLRRWPTAAREPGWRSAAFPRSSSRLQTDVSSSRRRRYPRARRRSAEASVKLVARPVASDEAAATGSRSMPARNDCTPRCAAGSRTRFPSSTPCRRGTDSTSDARCRCGSRLPSSSSIPRRWRRGSSPTRATTSAAGCRASGSPISGRFRFSVSSPCLPTSGTTRACTEGSCAPRRLPWTVRSRSPSGASSPRSRSPSAESAALRSRSSRGGVDATGMPRGARRTPRFPASG